ncbi:hypothetical protein IWZ01DRAFT_483200 [Phyllosticta capitalensis]
MSSKRSRTAESVPASSAKRPRAKNPAALSTANSKKGQSSSTPVTDVPLKVAIDVLTPAQQREALLHFAEQHAPLRDFIRNNFDEETKHRSAVIKKFDFESKDVWKEIYVLNRDRRGSKEYEAAGRVYRSINKTMRSIAKAARQPSSFGTRANAISTLRKIGKSIALSDGVLGKELKQSYSEEVRFNSFSKRFLELANSFSASEKKQVLKMTVKESTFEEKLEELLDLEEHLFPGLEVALDVLHGKRVDIGQYEIEEHEVDSSEED